MFDIWNHLITKTGGGKYCLASYKVEYNKNIFVWFIQFINKVMR